MKIELHSFQTNALSSLRMSYEESKGGFERTATPQIISFTAPTGSGKTIIVSALLESILFGDENYAEEPNTVVVWLSDSPELNEQSRKKIEQKSDKIRINQLVTISDDSFDQEVLEDGKIYFLNTQKLGKSSNLTKSADSRNHTIWETLENTIQTKSDRLLFIIDEAHRGAQGKNAATATTIMQKFIKGSEADHLSAMPVVLGMSATIERFQALVKGTTSTQHNVVVQAEDVRKSGLLKDRIIINYPEEGSGINEMAILQAAAEEWREKWNHWSQYCFEQHYAYVNPIMVIQVDNKKDDKVTETDLDDCIAKIESITGIRLQTGEVVHTFGQATSVMAHGLEIRYIEPSRISDDKKIKIVFFKENLSTGWDCPRAETMMSFRRATDYTYIAQLLGRMVRTPMQMHIEVDDYLNDVQLFLPYFDKENVKDVVKALSESEGGNIPTDIVGQSTAGGVIQTLTVKPVEQPTVVVAPGPNSEDYHPESEGLIPEDNPLFFPGPSNSPTEQQSPNFEDLSNNTEDQSPKSPDWENLPTKPINKPTLIPESFINREAIVKDINQNANLLSYEVRSVKITNYTSSLQQLVAFLGINGLDTEVKDHIVSEICEIMEKYIATLKETDAYSQAVDDVKQFKMSAQIFDVFGNSVDNYQIHDLFSSTDTDIDRQFRAAEAKLGKEGLSIAYGKRNYNPESPDSYKIDVIICVSSSSFNNQLEAYSKIKFHELDDKYRRLVTTCSDRQRHVYDRIVSNGDVISKHTFRLPETINTEQDENGKQYYDHLFVNNKTGFAKINLNPWEEGVLREEQKRSDYVCWFRNQPRKSWALCIPYEKDREKHGAYPDLIIVRKDAVGYVYDILEPHDPSRADNYGKAQGFAEYARENSGIGRIQLIRRKPNGSFVRLDMSKGLVRDKVLKAINNDDIDMIFETDGIIG